MIVRAGILSSCATGTGMKAYLLAAKCPNCWVTKHVLLYEHMSVCSVCRTRTEGHLPRPAEHLPGARRSDRGRGVACLEERKWDFSLIAFREITNHASQKRASHHLMTLAVPSRVVTNATVGHHTSSRTCLGMMEPSVPSSTQKSTKVEALQ
jgi:hypothetical protein